MENWTKERGEGPNQNRKGTDIAVKNVTMQFRRAKDEATSIKELLVRTLRREHSYEEFKALDNISFTVHQGEVAGIIGTNGSGKSTMLKIISGALIPTSGTVEVDRRKVQLLTLGTGFDVELTGRENVYLNGAIIGYTREYIDEKYSDIVKFAELEGFMEEKVRNYSSGMVSRLGFAIATVRDTPEILILDDSLSALDFATDAALRKAIGELEGNVTTFLVSQRISGIRQADKILVMEDGELAGQGTHEELMETCETYQEIYYSQFPEERPAAVKSSKETGKDLDKADKMTEKAEKGAAE